MRILSKLYGLFFAASLVFLLNALIPLSQVDNALLSIVSMISCVVLYNSALKEKLTEQLSPEVN